jgi:hypothetical protein
VVDSFDVNSTNTRELDVRCALSDVRLQSKQSADTFKLLDDCLGRFFSIPTPPIIRLIDLPVSEFTDPYFSSGTQALVRSRAITDSNGIVWPLSHCAIDSRSIFSVSGSASKVSPSSGRSTVTDAPSGNEASCNWTLPWTIVPEATRMLTFYRLR